VISNLPDNLQPITDNTTRSHGWKSRPWLAGALLFFLWFILCRQLSSEWSLNEQYSYGWFVPFFAAYLFWLRWEEIGGQRFATANPSSGGSEVRGRTSSIGGWGYFAVGASILALLVILPLRLLEIANPDWRPLGWLHAFAVITITFAVIYLARGWSWVRHFCFPILFILVAVPWVSPVEGPIVQGLMRIIASLAAETVSLLGVPAQVQGNLIRIASGVVGVNEACSGVRSLQTSLMIGLLFGELKRFSFWRRIFLVSGTVGIALMANLCRAVFLVWMASTRELAAVDRWHDFAGYGIVAVVFVGALALAAILNRDHKVEIRKEKGENAEEPSSRASPFLISNFYFPLSLLFLLAVEVGAESWYQMHERNLVPSASWNVRPPEKATGFRELKIEEGVRQTLRFDTGREVIWKTADADAPEISITNYLFFFRWNPGSSSVVRARAHRPDICLPSAGWKQIADRGTKTYSARDGVALPARHVTFKQEGSNAVVHTFFCLQEDKIHREEARPDLQLVEGVQPDWSAEARLLAVRNGIRNLGQQVLEVVFLTPRPIDDEAAEARFAELVREVVAAE
jgi:exosortase